MKKLFALLATVSILVFGSGSAQAQVVGACGLPQFNEVYDVFSNLGMRSRTVPGNQFQAVRDPSGMTFLLLPSAIPANRFWVTWDGRLVTINITNGVWSQVGQCQFHPAFVAAVMQPPPPPPMPNLDYNLVALQTGAGVPDVKLPTGQMNDEAEFLTPLKVDVNTAGVCLNQGQGDPNRFYDCIANQSMGQKEREIYRCMRSSGTSKEAVAMCALRTNLGTQEGAALAAVESCARQFGNNWNKYPACMASSAGDEKTQRAVACAQQSMSSGQVNYWGMATCYAGPQVLNSLNPNTETMVAVECAMSSGGQPQVFVGCTSGRLMANELNKCLTDGVGGNGGFGNGNTINKAYDAIDKQIKASFGSNTVAYQAWQTYAATTNPIYAARALNNIVREGGVAAENIAREAQKVMPRIKVKRIKIKW